MMVMERLDDPRRWRAAREEADPGPRVHQTLAARAPEPHAQVGTPRTRTVRARVRYAPGAPAAWERKNPTVTVPGDVVPCGVTQPIAGMKVTVIPGGIANNEKLIVTTTPGSRPPPPDVHRIDRAGAHGIEAQRHHAARTLDRVEAPRVAGCRHPQPVHRRAGCQRLAWMGGLLLRGRGAREQRARRRQRVSKKM
jgi:hypothetical protein